MPTPQEIRAIRLGNDYKEMCNIRGAIISWRAVKGRPPYVEAYDLSVRVRSIVGPGPEYREQHEIRLEIPAGYPSVPPKAIMISEPVVFHPNWWTDSRWCYGSWNIYEGLGHLVIRLVRTLQFDPVITNENSPANRAARNWYRSQKARAIFPCDNQVLPNPEKSKNEQKLLIRKRFQVR